VSAKLRPARVGFWHWCPACLTVHIIKVRGDGVCWEWDGDEEAPTFTPSFKVSLPQGDIVEICHYVITRGEIYFCSDSTHGFEGQTVPLADFPLDLPPAYTPQD